MAAPNYGIEATWTRRGVENGSSTPNPIPGLFGIGQVWCWTGPLPDIVLEPGSYVTIERVTTGVAGGSTVQATQVAIVTTRNPNTPLAATETITVGPYMLVAGPAA